MGVRGGEGKRGNPNPSRGACGDGVLEVCRPGATQDARCAGAARGARGAGASRGARGADAARGAGPAPDEVLADLRRR